ncbi:MAG: chorismate mutase [Proteobacteria bacterium]|nr:chorismate mutase [Pseudomonadota bacterium]
MPARAAPAAPCPSLAEVRAGIDRIDREIVRLLVERQGYVRQAARLKERRADVIVPERIEEIAARVRALAEAEGGDPDLVERIFRALVQSYIDFEFAEWDRRRTPGEPG